ncbi:MFS transporter [Rhodococcus qingshengii]|uniref:MFS transporter n=1 Tax=Rhodococcus qingshengii TaxID=334542 RepID=UPI0011F0177E|nr:MFS transporter [Rhodococcus qingshengii]QEM29803.1 MFS transporter [Rhodococcus qingshengii]WOI89160.1 MFS transporter [Rhodococcus qingshengii]
MGYVLTVILLGANMPTSVYGLYRTEFGFTPTIQTLIYGVYVAGLVPALLFFGPLSDALGRRTVLLTALALSVVGTLVLAFADATVWLFVGRIAQGIAVGAASAAGSAALVEQEPKFDHRRAALVSTVTGALGGALGPLVSGAIAQYLPQPLRLPYLIFLVAFIPALIVLLLLTRIGDVTRPKRFFQMPHVPAAIRETFWLSSLAVALSWGAVGLFQSVVPSWMTSLLNIDNLLLGGGAAALVMICSVVAQLGGSRMDPRTSVTAGLGILALGMIGLLVVDLVPSLALLGVITVVVGAGHGLAFAGGMKRVNAAARTHARESHGGVLAAFFTVSYAGLAIPSIIAGIAITLQGMQTAIIELSIIGTLLCLAVMGFNLRGAREPAEARRYP